MKQCEMKNDYGDQAMHLERAVQDHFRPQTRMSSGQGDMVVWQACIGDLLLAQGQSRGV